jgi:hypothetical protein
MANLIIFHEHSRILGKRPFVFNYIQASLVAIVRSRRATDSMSSPQFHHERQIGLVDHPNQALAIVLSRKATPAMSSPQFRH